MSKRLLILAVLSILISLVYLGCSKEEEPAQFNLTVRVTPNGGGTVNPASGIYDDGEQLSISATPSEGYVFSKWSGDYSGNFSPLSFKITADTEITAEFVINDEDGDGVVNNQDDCPNTPSGQQVDENGCSASQVDSDGDSIDDNLDQCPDTPEGEEVDELGCSASQKDSDNDGITDDMDQCSDTPEGEQADEQGCSLSQKDTDQDGVDDSLDECPNTPEGENVNEVGCSESQTDTDGDGVADDTDQCPDTPQGEEVDGLGCSTSQTDTDGDGVADSEDQCPDTPEDEYVDENGCSDSQKDTDGDGVTDDKDQCADSASGSNVDEYGCAASQTDGDEDGVANDKDLCPNTPPGETVDADGCSESQKDSDGDGIANENDSCPNTPSGEAVDSQGCSDSQKDSDGDGIKDNVDECPGTPSGEDVNPQGCSASQRDSDGDGVSDADDQCPNTPSGQDVDGLGCSTSQSDTDGDGVTDDIDLCPNTPSGETADSDGCAASQKDSDGDGIMDDMDTCPNTLSGESVDAQGCADSQKDSDGDGVTDDLDQCPNTPAGTNVDANGCEIVSRTYVPDDTFEQNLINLGYDDVLDDYVLTDNISNVISLVITGTIDPFYGECGGPIGSFTGLEDFAALEELELRNGYGDVDLSYNTNIKILRISLWSGAFNIENNLALEGLSIDGSPYICPSAVSLTDLSANINLKGLSIYRVSNFSLGDELDAILASVPWLESFGYSKEGISGSLDLRSNVNLKSLWLDAETVIGVLIDLRNGANHNLQGISFSAALGVDACIQADDPTYVETIVNGSTTQGPESVTITVTTNCSDTDGDGVVDGEDLCPGTPAGETVDENGCLISTQTYVPDDLFEQNLIDLGYDDVLDDYVLTHNIKNIVSLILDSGTGYPTNIGISDFTGIEDFDSLEDLEIKAMDLYDVDIDFSKNINLRRLKFYCTIVGSINLKNNVALEDFTMIGDPSNGECISYVRDGLDLSGNTNLRTLYLSGTIPLGDELNTLLVTIPSLESFRYWGGAIENKSLDLSSNINLKSLEIGVEYHIFNFLIDLRNGANNKLESITLGANFSISEVCIQVDNPAYVETIVSIDSLASSDYRVTTDCGS